MRWRQVRRPPRPRSRSFGWIAVPPSPAAAPAPAPRVAGRRTAEARAPGSAQAVSGRRAARPSSAGRGPAAAQPWPAHRKARNGGHRRSSPQVPKRSSGDFASALATTSSTPAPSSGLREVSAGGGSSRWAYSTCTSESFLYGTTPGEALTKHAAQRVDVSAAVELVALDLLRRRVVERADEGAGLRQTAVVAALLGDAEVGEVDVIVPPSARDRMLAGFTSRWTRPVACAASRASRDLREQRERRARRRAALPLGAAAGGRCPRRSASRCRAAVGLAGVVDRDDVAGARARPRAATRAGSARGSPGRRRALRREP